MIDAYTIGITLALDNGVSAGLATIRRDLIALNSVVDGSATRLKHLTRAAADLHSHPGVVERTSGIPRHRRAGALTGPYCPSQTGRGWILDCFGKVRRIRPCRPRPLCLAPLSRRSNRGLTWGLRRQVSPARCRRASG